MKILMICEFYDPALEYQENALARAYVALGHSVTVVTSTYTDVSDFIAERPPPPTPDRQPTEENPAILRLPYRFNLLNRLRPFAGLQQILDHVDPDFIFVHDISLNFPEILKYVDHHDGTSIVMDYHGDYSNSGKNWLSRTILHGMIRKHFLDRARPRIRKILPVVPSGAEFLRDIYRVPSDEMELLPLGADLGMFDRLRRDGVREKLRASLELPAGHVVVFTGGKLTREKRTDLLLRAVADLRQDLQLTLVVAGALPADDPEYTVTLSRFFASGTPVKFLGWLNREDVSGWLLASDIAVFPASQSVLWQQAIAAGLPLIVGDSGKQDPSYLNLCDNVIILTGDQISSSGISTALRDLVVDVERRDRMGQGSLMVARDLLDWNRIAARTLEFVDMAS